MSTPEIQDLKNAIDTAWLIVTGAGVFLMQAGFALVEAGSMRSKNVVGVLMKNFTDAAIGALVYYLWGYAFCFGASKNHENNFIGNTKFAIKELENTPKEFAMWFFQFTFCATAATIVSGACAERVKFSVYLLFSAFMTGWIYPVVVHSAWSTEGWLSPLNDGSLVSKVGPSKHGVIDFAGSGVVHLVGGTASLIGSWMIGPRLGRFRSDGTPAEGFQGHSAHMTTLGTFMLFFSWYSFNCGSTLGMTGGLYQTAARAAMTTTICGMVAPLTCLTVGWLASGRTKLTLSHCMNGALGGLVAITAGCAVVPAWAAVVIGIVSGLCTFGGPYLMLNVFKIDDPVDASTVHGINGILGVLAPGFFASEEAVSLVYGFSRDYAGVFMGGDGHQLGYQLLFIVWVTGWTMAWTAIAFLALKFTLGLRADAADEARGLDITSYGGLGYDTLVTEAEVKFMRTQIRELQAKCGITPKEFAFSMTNLPDFDEAPKDEHNPLEQIVDSAPGQQ